MDIDQSVNVAVVYYSQTGTVYELAQAVSEGAAKAGAEVRLRRVKELAPSDVVSSKKAWQEHLEATASVPEASVEDLVWADAVLIGTPTRYGNISSQMQQFIDTTGPAWHEGKLANKVYSGFTAAGTAHGGHESTLLVLNHIFTHWGGVIVPPGYTDGIQFAVGTPYGSSYVAAEGGPQGAVLESARYQAQRATEFAQFLKRGRLAA